MRLGLYFSASLKHLERNAMNSLDGVLASGADVTVSSGSISFEQELFETVSEYPLLYDSS